MAVADDLNKLAALEVVYLSRRFGGGSAFSGVLEVYRGRVRQALSGDWVFNASTGSNGVVGFVLGTIQGSWTSDEAPATGLTVVIPTRLIGIGVGTSLDEVVTLTSVIPADFAD